MLVIGAKKAAGLTSDGVRARLVVRVRSSELRGVDRPDRLSDTCRASSLPSRCAVGESSWPYEWSTSARRCLQMEVRATQHNNPPSKATLHHGYVWPPASWPGGKGEARRRRGGGEGGLKTSFGGQLCLMARVSSVSLSRKGTAPRTTAVRTRSRVHKHARPSSLQYTLLQPSKLDRWMQTEASPILRGSDGTDTMGCFYAFKHLGGVHDTPNSCPDDPQLSRRDEDRWETSQ